MGHARLLRENLRFCPEFERKRNFLFLSQPITDRINSLWNGKYQVLNRANITKFQHFFPSGEIAKYRRVNRKTREINSSSEESEADDDNDLEEPVEVEEDDYSHGGEMKSDSDEESEKDHREAEGKESDEKLKKKYGKGMKVFCL